MLPPAACGVPTGVIEAVADHAFAGLLLDNGIAISMDGRVSWRHNVFVQRLWRSVKYEEVYPRAYETVAEARG